jgi:hypothetical protein
VHEASRAKRRATAAVAATAAIGSAAVPATLAQPAMANHPKDTCPGNTLCEWKDANFAGPVKWWSATGNIDSYQPYTYDSDHSVGLDPGGQYAKGTVSSVWNNTNRWVKLCNYNACNTTGAPDTEYGVCLGPDKAISYLGANNSGWNDVLSAHRTYTSQPDRCEFYGSQEGCSL